MTKYNVGDKVKVKADLIEDARYGMDNNEYKDIVVDSMMRFAGQVVTIAEIIYTDELGERYNIIEDADEWNWTDEMFE